MHHDSQEDEAKRILRVFREDPRDHRALLGVTGKLAPLALHKRRQYFSELFEEEGEAFDLVRRAHDLLLYEYVSRKQNSALFRAAFLIALASFAGIFSYLLKMVWSDVTIWNLLGSLTIAFLTVDCVTGLGHLFLDHFIPFENPVFGDVALDFNFHHQDPENITRMTPNQIFKPLVVYGLPLAAVIALLLFLTGNTLAILSGLWVGPLFCASQLIHRLSHFDRPPNQLTHWLQRMRIFLPPEQHQKHHRDGERINFCTLNGLCNPLVNLMAAGLLKRRRETG